MKIFGILQRYILKETGITYIYTVASFMLLLSLGSILKLMDMGVSPAEIITYIPFIAIINLPFVLPLGFITGYILTFSRLSVDREIQIIRVSGVPLSRIVIPHLIGAFLISAGAFFFYQNTIPHMRQQFFNSILSIFRDIPPVTETYNKPSLSLNRGKDNIYLISGSNRDIKGLVIQQVEKGRLKQITFAEQGSIERTASNILTFHMKKVSRLIIREDYIDHPYFAELSVDIPVKDNEAEKAAGNDYSLKTGSQLLEMASDTKIRPSRRRRAELRFWLRASLALACFSFTLFAIPSGLSSEQKAKTAGFLKSILYALFVFFPLLMGLRSFLRDSTAFPAHLLMLPNWLFIGYGSLIMWKELKK